MSVEESHPNMPSHSPDQPNARQRRIGILCLSAIPDDPRVRKQGDLLTQAGWDVVAIGLPGARSPAPGWTCLAVGEGGNSVGQTLDNRDDVASSQEDYIQRTVVLRHAFREWKKENSGLAPVMAAAMQLVLRDPAATIWLASHIPSIARHRVVRPQPSMATRKKGKTWIGLQLGRMRRAYDVARLSLDRGYAKTVYWRLNDRFSQIYNLARLQKVDFWLANDWTTLPIAQRLAAEQGVPYAYDTHELAVDEYAQNRIWRLTQRPVIASVERSGIARAAFATCVSDGIADRLHEFYKLENRPIVIRNTPMYRQQFFRPTGGTIEVLYHGVVAPGRGLEACIRSVFHWREEFRLTIRGPSSPAYLASLKAEVEAAGISGRVIFDEPVPMTELVARAATFDVGLFSLPDHSLQNVYVLPNKFFEYTMAGLALCVSDLPEMTRLLRKHDLGELIDSVSPEAIANAINRLSRSNIDRFKRNSLIAAKELNWEVEGKRLIDECYFALK